jgi:Fe-S cluster assembly ATP-binding protein|tara:strand:- start:8626 stop:9393 length:768 start_codon:yes stop_codon:yes gene_type:complete
VSVENGFIQMLTIKNLHAEIDNKSILKGVDLEIKPGEMHAIMGRNGSGKSTLSNVITGRDSYLITNGSIHLENESIVDWTPEKRSLEGIFMSFQYPVVIPGVNNTYFLKAALNAKRKYLGQKELDAAGFLKVIKEKLNELDMDPKFLQRPVNQGFSGGEKKRNEILQMLTLEPKLAILDETDSGLDIDALKIIAEGVNRYRNSKRSFLVITHYQRLLKYIQPDFIHVLIDGKIVKSGGKELALELEEKGYNWLDS